MTVRLIAAEGPASLSQFALTVRSEFLLQPFGKEYLQQGLIRHIALISERLEAGNHGNRETQRNRSDGWLKMWEKNPLPFGPIQIIHRVVIGPKFSLFGF